MHIDSTNINTDQKTLASGRSIASLTGKFLFFTPGLLILIVVFSTKLGQSNPFIMLTLFLLGGIVGLIGFIIYLITEKQFKSKIITVLSGITFYVLLLPIIWGVNGLRERIYIYKHRANLEIIANNILISKLSIDEANEILKSENSILKVICVPKENKHVLFLLEGVIDNCTGFAYSLTDNKPSQNCCGDLISWKKILMNWHKWGTT